MKHLKTFTELVESSSAGSNSPNDVIPFKYTTVYDPRIGYNKTDFIDDLNLLTQNMDEIDKRDLGLIIQSVTGSSSFDSILNLRSKSVEQLIKLVEEFMSSKADFELRLFPDGYVLCFENIRGGNSKFDIYYHPKKGMIKLVTQTPDAIEPETLIPINNFDPTKIGIETNDFELTIKKADSIFKQKETSDKTQQ